MRPGHPYLAGAPLLVAHRGGASLAPENTLTAFIAAVERWGADMIELDAHVTRDGEVVVIHDPSVDRTTDGTGPVAEMTWAEVRELDAGARWRTPDGDAPFAGKGIGIPRLSDLLERLPDTRLNVDAKAPGVAGPLVDVVRSHGAEHRVLLAAEHERLRADALGRWNGPVGATRRQIAGFMVLARLPWLAPTPRADALQIPVRWPVAGRVRTILTAGVLREAHRRNVPVHVWTIDDPDEMEHLLEMGVDAVQTDRPDLLARVLHRRTGRPLPPAAEPEAPPPVVGATAPFAA
jgi:glycerophosphoryl diester phosphodiesterase